jgi:hypothetical protein
MRHAIPLALLLFGCATVGKEFDTTHANEVQTAVHDKQQMRAWFGEPHQVTSPLPNHPAGCVERWQWTYAHSVAGGSTESQSLVVDFDAAGKVCDHAFATVQQ